MKIKIDDARKLAIKAIKKLGFSIVESELITRNLIEAEMVEKKTHGLIRIPALKRNIAARRVNVSGDLISIISETTTSIHINGKFKPGFIVLYQSLESAISKVRKSGVVTVALKDLGYASGYIGDYARIATENNLIFIGVNNSPGGLIPHGTVKELWGTNPLTVGIPTNNIPVILDMAASKITWGDLLVAKQENKRIPQGVALDKDGNPTDDAAKAIEGGLLPIGGHKGSGLAFIVELLAGALTGSRVGYAIEGGWGSFYLLIDPTLFRPLAEFKNDIALAVRELKKAPKAKRIGELYYAGEKSGKLRKQHLELGDIDVSDSLLNELNNLT